MENKANEKGYALLIVLLLIVFITILTAVFLRGSISNAKQEQRVDINNLTVTAAESGVDYYQTKLSNAYYTSLPEMKKKYLEKLAEEQKRINNQKRGTVNYSYINSEVRKVLSNALQVTASSFSEPILLPKGYAFKTNVTEKLQGDYLSVTPLDGKVLVKAIVEGFKDSSSRQLAFEQTLLIPDFSSEISPGDEQGSSSPLQKPDVDFHNLGAPFNTTTVCAVKNQKIEYSSKNNGDMKPSYGETCTYSKYVKEIVNTRVSSGRIFHQEKIDLDNSIVYHGDGAQIRELELEKSYLYINGGLDIYEKNSGDGGSLDLEDYSKLIGNGSLKVNGDVDIEKSELFFRGDVDIANDLEVDDNSYIYFANSSKNEQLLVNNDFEIDESIAVIENPVHIVNEFDIDDSKVLIENDLKVNSEIDIDNSTLIVTGDLHAKDLELEDNSKVCVAGKFKVTGELEFDDDDDDDEEDNDNDDDEDNELPSYIYLLSTPNPNHYQNVINQGRIIILKNREEFNEICYTTNNSNGVTKWPKPNIEVNYLKN